MAKAPPCVADIRAAAQRLSGLAVRTPLLESPALNARLGGRLLVKAEMLQRTGSFKFRGAYNCVSQRAVEGARGVVAYSSGNHAQGVAAAAGLVGIPAVIVMPADAPRGKIDNTRALGADVVLYDRETEDREAIGGALAAEKGFVLVPPYDDPDVIAGQGTIGLELAEQAVAVDGWLDAVLCPCGGGGMIAGIAIALEDVAPGVVVHPVEPFGFDDTRRSLETGHKIANAPDAVSFCDALLTPAPGDITFAANRHRLSPGLAVTDDEVADAMRKAFQHLKVVVEPGGAVALAACLSGHFDIKGRTVAVVCSGGNVDADLFTRALKATATRSD